MIVPMDAILVGMDIDSKALHWEQNSLGIYVSLALESIVIFFKDEHPRKVDSPIMIV